MYYTTERQVRLTKESVLTTITTDYAQREKLE